MDFIGIRHKKITFGLLFVLLILFSITSFAKKPGEESKAIKNIINHLYDQYNNPVQIIQSGIYIMMTQKSCLACYTDLEKHLLKTFPKLVTHLIIVMPENPLLIRSKIQMISPYFTNQPIMYFYYFENEDNPRSTSGNFYSNLMNSPSPYFFIINEEQKDLLKLFNFNETMEMIYPGENVEYKE